MSKQSYPSPTNAQVSSGAGPFYNPNTAEPQHNLHELQQLTAADIPRPQAVMGGPSTGSDYDSPGPPIPPNMHHGSSSAERLAQGVLNMSEHEHHELSTPDTSRKRSKVSRACDECRRKKIRCDATSDPPDEPCSNCKRTQAQCQFSRQPMKRGPSKGYIKELADRLNSLENQLGPPVHSMGQDANFLRDLSENGIASRIEGLAEYATPTGLTRKRTHSVSEGPGFGGRDAQFAPTRTGTWDAQRQAPNPPAGFQAPQTPQVTAAELNNFAQQSSPGGGWRFSTSEPRNLENLSAAYDTDLKDTDPTNIPEWDDAILDEFYRLYQPTFPILPHSKVRLRSRLLNCPAILRMAFLTALECAIRGNSASTLSAAGNPTQQIRAASDLIGASQFDTNSGRTTSANLVYLQTLILMALEADNHGPAQNQGHIGPIRSEWLGRAIGIATHFKLNMPRLREELLEGDPDSDEKLGRRIWWALFILDRWHASSTASLLQIPETGSSLLAEDQDLLGDTTYQLARLSYILGHIVVVLQQPSLIAPQSAAAPIINIAILGEIDRFRESIETVFLSSPNLVHISYWHARLLTLRIASTVTPHELLHPALRIAGILSGASSSLTPLQHHFAALSAMTLVELTNLEETRQEADKGLEDILNAYNVPSKKPVGAGARDENISDWDSAIRELISRRKIGVGREANGGPANGTGSGSGSGLQHLADAAVGKDVKPATGENASNKEGGATNGANGAATGFDPTLLTKFGYLAALAEDTSTR